MLDSNFSFPYAQSLCLNTSSWNGPYAVFVCTTKFKPTKYHQSQDLRVVDQEYAQLSNPLCNRKNDSESILAYQISTIMAT